ncbi:MAG: hypothetical protein PHY72_01940 [Candidatus Pacebacteria bacterium]|nr:hypothetical protein [Candidatus Paceibacterota bacterium]
MKMKEIKKLGKLKWLLAFCVIALALIASGCDFLDKKGERSDVVITGLIGGHYKERQAYGSEVLVQYGVWIGCVLKNKSNVRASVTSDWKFQIDDDLTIDAGNVRSYFEKVKMPSEIAPLEEATIYIEFLYDSWNGSALSGTKFSTDFFTRWHTLKATISIEDDNGHSYRVSSSDKEDF